MADFPFVKPGPTHPRPKVFQWNGQQSGKTPQSVPFVRVIRKREKKATNG